MTWSELPLSSKSELMRIYLENGISSLDDMKEHYNHFSEGGPISVNTWKTMMKAKYPDIEFDNYKAGYDYDEYFKNNYLEAIKQLQNLQHFPDTYKLPNHKTFSDESIYSRGPNMGGSWSDNDEFTPSVINKQAYPDIYKEDRPYTEREIYNSFATGGPLEEKDKSIGFWKSINKHIDGVVERNKIRNHERIRNNDTPTAKASEKLEEGMNRYIWDTERHPEVKAKYMIPYIPEKEIIIDGNRTSENVLDTLYKYSQLANLSFVDALGLANQETGFGSMPVYNMLALKDKPKRNDGTLMSKKDIERYNNELANSNYFRNYGAIPANNLVRNFHWEKDTDMTEHPLINAFNYFKAGKYNPKSSSHTADVRMKGLSALNSPAVKAWKKKKGIK